MASPVICVHDDRQSLKFENCKIFSFGNYSYVSKLEGRHGNIIIQKQPTSHHNLERYQNIAMWACSVMKLMKVDKVIIENYAYSGNGAICDIAEATGILKYELFKRKIPISIVEPTSAKLQFTGKGRAPKGYDNKSWVYESFKRITGVDPAAIINFASVYTTEKQKAKIKEKPWDIKPLDDVCDAYAVLTCHEDYNIEVKDAGI